MTHEDKELLLQDLCARLPYNCRVFYEYVDDLDGKTYGYSLTLNTWCIDEFVANKAVIKPYLRPMSSMTLEEHRDWMKYCKADYDCEFQPEPIFDFESCILSINWLNQHHFDYNNLIEEGLAIEVTKENNPYKE